MKSVAIVGRGRSREHAKDSQADELWGIGAAYRDHAFQFDRIYEIHTREAVSHPNYNPTHWVWLKRQPAGVVRIMMQDGFDEIPCAELYPFEDALALCRGIYRGDEEVKIFTSSFDWAIAHAILEGVERIELYGVDISPTVRIHEADTVGAVQERTVSTEYVYQRPGAWGWAMFAASRGITVWTPEQSPLFDTKVYGLSGTLGAQMVTIDHIRELQAGIRDWRMEHSFKMRELDAIWDMAETDEEKVANQKTMEALRRLVFIADGAFQALEQIVNETSIDGWVGRQMIETARQRFEHQRQSRMSDLNYQLGRARGLEESGAMEQRKAMVPELQKMAMGVFVTIGCEQVMEWLIDDCDGKPNEYTLINPISEFEVK